MPLDRPKPSAAVLAVTTLKAAVLAAIVLAPATALAQSIEREICTTPAAGEERVIEIHRLSATKVACRVIYIKPGGSRQIYAANTKEGVCEGGQQSMVNRLTRAGWQCTAAAPGG